MDMSSYRPMGACIAYLVTSVGGVVWSRDVYVHGRVIKRVKNEVFTNFNLVEEAPLF